MTPILSRYFIPGMKVEDIKALLDLPKVEFFRVGVRERSRFVSSDIGAGNEHGTLIVYATAYDAGRRKVYEESMGNYSINFDNPETVRAFRKFQRKAESRARQLATILDASGREVRLNL